jgi:anti-anti-sigma factor
MTATTSYHGSTPGNLRIERKLDADGVVLVLAGELDLASSPALDRQLRELDGTNPGRLLIDLSRLDFMDSTGLAIMIGAQQSAQDNGHRLSLRPGPGQVQRLFELTGVLDRFTFEE